VRKWLRRPSKLGETLFRDVEAVAVAFHVRFDGNDALVFNTLSPSPPPPLSLSSSTSGLDPGSLSASDIVRRSNAETLGRCVC
jgi:hypothetical protein